MREWLKKLRTDNGLTMREMGEKLGISESYYCTIESGDRQKRMNLKLASGIANVFGISVDQVVAYDLNRV